MVVRTHYGTCGLTMQRLNWVCSRFLLLLLLFGVSISGLGADKNKTGTLLLVGEVLSFKQRAVWKRIFQLAGSEAADVVVIPAANARAKLYGSFAQRALSRYGPFVELLPLAETVSEFGIDYRQAITDLDLIEQVRGANVVFFVGGAPQRLAKVMNHENDSAAPMAEAIRHVYASGGVIVGGIPSVTGAHTGINAMQLLEQGQLSAHEFYRGFGLTAPDWYVDQHFFAPGRFAETLIAMQQLGTRYGIGVGTNAAAVIKQNQLEVIGDTGVMLIDLSIALANKNESNFILKAARLSYLDDGDRFDLVTQQLTPHSSKLDGFEINPNATDHQPLQTEFTVAADMFAAGKLQTLLLNALDSEAKQAIGLAMQADDSNNNSSFRFRFYTGDDTLGWLTVKSGSKRFTVKNMYLDIASISRLQAAELLR